MKTENSFVRPSKQFPQSYYVDTNYIDKNSGHNFIIELDIRPIIRSLKDNPQIGQVNFDSMLYIKPLFEPVDFEMLYKKIIPEIRLKFIYNIKDGTVFLDDFAVIKFYDQIYIDLHIRSDSNDSILFYACRYDAKVADMQNNNFFEQHTVGFSGIFALADDQMNNQMKIFIEISLQNLINDVDRNINGVDRNEHETVRSALCSYLAYLFLLNSAGDNIIVNSDMYNAAFAKSSCGFRCFEIIQDRILLIYNACHNMDFLSLLEHCFDGSSVPVPVIGFFDSVTQSGVDENIYDFFGFTYENNISSESMHEVIESDANLVSNDNALSAVVDLSLTSSSSNYVSPFNLGATENKLNTEITQDPATISVAPNAIINIRSNNTELNSGSENDDHIVFETTNLIISSVEMGGDNSNF